MRRLFVVVVIDFCFLVLSGVNASASVVHTVKRDPRNESKSWEHRVVEAGDYQIGQAWVHILKGDKLRE